MLMHDEAVQSDTKFLIELRLKEQISEFLTVSPVWQQCLLSVAFCYYSEELRNKANSTD